MKKLVLELDALKVESFSTGAGRNPDGTVRGHLYVRDSFVNELEWQQEEAAVTVPREPATKGWSCPIGCTDGCTAYSCASGAPVCCA